VGKGSTLKKKVTQKTSERKRVGTGQCQIRRGGLKRQTKKRTIKDHILSSEELGERKRIKSCFPALIIGDWGRIWGGEGPNKQNEGRTPFNLSL